MSNQPALTIHRAQFSAARRSRGGQLGNDNALKHGFYSRQFSRADFPGLDNLDPGGMRDEVILLRVILRRVLSYAREVKDLPTALTLLRGISVATHSIARIMRTQYYVNGNNPESNLDIALAIHQAAQRVMKEKGAIGWVSDDAGDLMGEMLNSFADHPSNEQSDPAPSDDAPSDYSASDTPLSDEGEVRG